MDCTKKNQYINLNELFFIRPMPYKKEYFEITKKLLNLEDSFKVNRRVFLNRSIKSGRYIENFKEINKILDKYNFEIVDTTGTTLEFQANLFNSINYLVSIHGAGETNIIFANKQLNFLEINPLNRIACQYYWLAIEMGIAYYDVVLGDSLPETHVYPEKGFYLEPEKFESAIIKMLNKI